MKTKQNALPNSGLPMKWNEFEEEVKALGFHLHWQRSPGLDDTLAITGSHSRWVENINTEYALSRYIRTRKKNLGESKREITSQGAEIIADLKNKLARVDRLLPIARALRADKRTISIQPSGIVVKEWYYEITIDDDFHVTARREVHHGLTTIGELEEMISDMTRTRADYETALEPFLVA